MFACILPSCVRVLRGGSIFGLGDLRSTVPAGSETRAERLGGVRDSRRTVEFRDPGRTVETWAEQLGSGTHAPVVTIQTNPTPIVLLVLTRIV